jgi:molybdopterin-synthase adenylyltransferase
MDVVLGCVDNVEARRFINRACRLVGRPWIDSGINELAGQVSLYSPTEPVCYECVLTNHQLAMARKRYSCDQVKRAFVEQARIPTVQVTSSIISGIQVQECVKLLCGGIAMSGQRIWFDGSRNQFEVFNLRPHPECEMHAAFGEVIDVELSCQSSVKQALEYLISAGFGTDPILDTLGVRQLVEEAECRKCGRSISLYRPLHAVTEHDLICDSPHNDRRDNQRAHVEPEQPIKKKTNSTYSLRSSSSKVLAMKLADVGIPPADIMAVQVPGGRYSYVRLGMGLPVGSGSGVL